MSFEYRAGWVKQRVGRLLTSRVAGLAVGMIAGDRIRCRGVSFETSDPVVSPEVKAAMAFGLYESAEIRFVQAHVSMEDDFVVELGGSLGVVGAHALKRMSTNGTLVSVEANPGLLDHLRRTLTQHSGPGQTTHVVHSAIQYGVEEARLRLGATSQGSVVGSQGIAVPCTTLGSILDRFVVPSSFVLISDIEGAESQILDHEPALLRRCSKIIIELHETGPGEPDPNLMRARLLELGFKECGARGPVLCLRRR